MGLQHPCSLSQTTLSQKIPFSPRDQTEIDHELRLYLFHFSIPSVGIWLKKPVNNTPLNSVLGPIGKQTWESYRFKKKKSALSLINLGWKTRLEHMATGGFLMSPSWAGRVWTLQAPSWNLTWRSDQMQVSCQQTYSKKGKRRGKAWALHAQIFLSNSLSDKLLLPQGAGKWRYPVPLPQTWHTTGAQRVFAEFFFFLMAEIQASTYCLAKTIEGTLHTHLLHYKPVSRH